MRNKIIVAVLLVAFFSFGGVVASAATYYASYNTDIAPGGYAYSNYTYPTSATTWTYSDSNTSIYGYPYQRSRVILYNSSYVGSYVSVYSGESEIIAVRSGSTSGRLQILNPSSNDTIGTYGRLYRHD